MQICILDNYDSFTYNLFQQAACLGHSQGFSVAVYRNDQVTVSDLIDISPAGIIISPGPGRPSNVGVCREVVQHFMGQIPILGVCLGHQLLAEMVGGKVERAKCAVHGKTSFISHNASGLFNSLKSPIKVARYHSLVVDGPSVASAYSICAQTEDDVVMAIQHKELPVGESSFIQSHF